MRWTRFFQCEGHCQRFRNTRVSLNLKPQSLWLMCVLFHACSHGYVQSIFKTSSGCTMLRWFFVPWNMNSSGLLLTFPPALSRCRAETSVSHLDFSGQFVAVLPLHFFESCPVPVVCFLFFWRCPLYEKKSATIWLSEFRPEAAEALLMNVDIHGDVPMPPGRFTLDLQWNWLIFNWINQSVNISNRF